jgi:hypothetical protein
VRFAAPHSIVISLIEESYVIQDDSYALTKYENKSNAINKRNMNTNAIPNLENNIRISEMVISGRIYKDLFLDSQDCQILLTLNWSC